MSIVSIVISRIEPKYTAEYIANVLWNSNIARVNSITLLPYLQGSDVFQRAYVNIAEWTDSEIAYNFIKRLNNVSKKTRLVHHNDLWWPVKLNFMIAGFYYIRPYTIVFPKSYFIKPETIEDKPETIEEEGVIPKYKSGAKYTVDQAIARCEELDKAIMVINLVDDLTDRKASELFDLCEELDYIEEQLRAYGNKRLESDERCIQSYRSQGQFMSVKDTNARLDFLKTILTKCSPTTSVSHWGVQVIKDEIEFLEDQLFSIVTLKSQNVTLRPHQQQLVV